MYKYVMLNRLYRFCTFLKNKIVVGKKKQKSISAVRREALRPDVLNVSYANKMLEESRMNSRSAESFMLLCIIILLLSVLV